MKLVNGNSNNSKTNNTTGVSILNTIETSPENVVIISNDKNIGNNGESPNNKHRYVMDANVLHLQSHCLCWDDNGIALSRSRSRSQSVDPAIDNIMFNLSTSSIPEDKRDWAGGVCVCFLMIG